MYIYIYIHIYSFHYVPFILVENQPFAAIYATKFYADKPHRLCSNITGPKLCKNQRMAGTKSLVWEHIFFRYWLHTVKVLYQL